MKLSKNFSLSEFACRDGTPVPPDRVDNLQKWVEMELQKVRDFFDLPMTITSGYRTVEYNRRVGGAKRSKHVYPRNSEEVYAADFQVSGLEPAKVGRAVNGLIRIGVLSAGGLGIYPDKLSRHGWVHLDNRGINKRWRG
jgi:uncharacterized protein YcbK (DUF882 family)